MQLCTYGSRFCLGNGCWLAFLLTPPSRLSLPYLQTAFSGQIVRRIRLRLTLFGRGEASTTLHPFKRSVHVSRLHRDSRCPEFGSLFELEHFVPRFADESIEQRRK